jgi:hypothetical protein
MKVLSIFLYFQYILSTLLESFIIYYISNYYLKGFVFIDILFSYMFTSSLSFFYILEIFDVCVLIGILCIDSIRIYCYFWIFFILKNLLLYILIEKTVVPKKDLLLDDLDETSTVLSV